MVIYLVNQSKNPALTTDALKAIAAAVTRQLLEDFTPAYGLEPACLEFVAEADAPAFGVQMHIVDDATQPDALGFHAETDQGVPISEVSLNAILSSGGDIYTKPNSLSVTISHEACELLGDPRVDAYAMASDGTFYAWEVCDAVEAQSYTIDGIAVSDFVYPSWFDTIGQAPFSKVGGLTAPFTLADGGYASTVKSPGTSALIFRRYPEQRKARKRTKHPRSRYARRLAKRGQKAA